MRGRTGTAATGRRRPGSRLLRQGRLVLRRAVRATNLTQRFLIVSVLVVFCAMAVLGAGVGHYVVEDITKGVATTAAASVDSLVANSVDGMFAGETLSAADRQRLDAAFDIGSDAETTRLIQIRILRLDGSLLYEASDGVIDKPQSEEFERARDGEVSSEVLELPLAPAGPFGSHPISLLRLYTPLHQPGTGEIFAVAALYYSARSLLDIQFEAQVAVWTIVLLAGLFIIVAFQVFVGRANRTIVRQAKQLSANLEESRRLSEEIRGLHRASEELRIEAIEANEQLLARVGSDIHDGPLQLLTLVIMQLARVVRTTADTVPAGLQNTVDLTARAVTELRTISAGLVLPEIAELTLSQTLLLAISRHEGVTGTQVHHQVNGLDHRVEPDIQVCLYRVVQESLSNAFHHSGGVEQTVVAEQLEGRLSVEISNARQSQPLEEDAAVRPKLGLRSMRLRVEAVGGNLAVEMSNTRVTVRVTVPSPAPPAEP